jgi:uncharacterized protein (DUF1778 family)
METQKRKAGRPAVAGAARSERIMVRLTEDEYEVLRLAAGAYGMDVSGWVRTLAVNAAISTVQASVEDADAGT